MGLEAAGRATTTGNFGLRDRSAIRWHNSLVSKSTPMNARRVPRSIRWCTLASPFDEAVLAPVLTSAHARLHRHHWIPGKCIFHHWRRRRRADVVGRRWRRETARAHGIGTAVGGDTLMRRCWRFSLLGGLVVLALRPRGPTGLPTPVPSARPGRRSHRHFQIMARHYRSAVVPTFTRSMARQALKRWRTSSSLAALASF